MTSKEQSTLYHAQRYMGAMNQTTFRSFDIWREYRKNIKSLFAKGKIEIVGYCQKVQEPIFRIV